MAIRQFAVAALAALTGVLMATPRVQPGEGMWLFNNPPKKLLKEQFGFDKDQAWYDHVQKSSVRFNSGGSGSFVSADGLVMTNHHVGADQLQKMSSKEKNYLKEGFQAKDRKDEVKCTDLELNVLMSIEDVTDRVNQAVKADMSSEKAFAARRAVMSEIEKESLDKTKLRSDVITLYQGGQYHLYRFKKYTDVRLVFAPEQQIAFYGGDPDNFEYPRFDLDICFFRVYENDQAIKCEHYLTWSKAGAADNELVFVSGHPGRTSRQYTMTELAYARDRQFPAVLDLLYRREVALTAYSARSAENARKAREELFGVQNSRKARDGGMGGLLDPALIARKQSEEQRLRDVVAKDPNLKDAASAWDRIEESQKAIGEVAWRYNLLETGRGFHSTLFEIARTLVRAAAEKQKPNAQRLREFRESAQESLEQQLFSNEPIYNDFEEVKLADSLTYLAEKLGYSNPTVQKVLAGKSPRERAHDLVAGCGLKEIDARKKLYEGGQAAVSASKDPMVLLVTEIDEESRAVRKTVETQDEVKRQAHAQLAKAKFALEGTSTYPDATFTLRLAYGVVKGYEENGVAVPFQTTLAGLYERAKEHDNKEPFELPARWIERKDKLDLSTPFNFVCTADIIGGNSGSPVINANAELVGIIFDGNIQSLVLDFIYDETVARAVSVHSAGIIEALRKVYDANDLADELTGRKK
ncbi:MAG: S46 family peptidase [Gemmataceae bacterium]